MSPFDGPMFDRNAVTVVEWEDGRRRKRRENNEDEDGKVMQNTHTLNTHTHKRLHIII